MLFYIPNEMLDKQSSIFVLATTWFYVNTALTCYSGVKTSPSLFFCVLEITSSRHCDTNSRRDATHR